MFELLTGPILTTLLLGAFVWFLVTMKLRDEARIRRDFQHDEGEITQIKLVSLGSRNNAPRVYRVVLTLPNGGRLLHRVALRQDGGSERLL